MGMSKEQQEIDDLIGMLEMSVEIIKKQHALLERAGLAPAVNTGTESEDEKSA
jgi:hypothetical protein